MSFTDLLITSDLLLLVTPVPTTNHVITTQSHVGGTYCRQREVLRDMARG